MSNHRGARRASKSTRVQAEATAYSSAGKRSAGRRKATVARERSPFTFGQTSLPAIPTVIGATALVVAGAGVVGLSGNPVQGSNLSLSSGASTSISGASAVAPSVDSRIRAISRDSNRQAMQDAADQALKSVAEKQNKQRNAALAKLRDSAEKRASDIKKNLWHMPVADYRLTARFGMGGGLWARGHTGLDFAGPVGTPIVAVANGTITETGYDGAYGNKTVLTLDDGTEIWYCHQNAINVNVGDKVVGGQQLGQRGSTGNSTGPHLHLEVRPGGGDPVDPYSALLFHGLSL